MSKAPFSNATSGCTDTDLQRSDGKATPRVVIFWDGGFAAAELHRSPLLIGRSSDCDLCVDHPSVSRRHAVVHADAAVAWIEDLGSSNGTWVRGGRVEPRRKVPLRPGDSLQIGHVQGMLVGVAPESSQPSQVRAAAEPDIDRPGILVRDSAMQQVMRLVAAVAPTDISVLLIGETGVGKELVAEAVHAASPRARRALVRINCAALPESLFESELFGHERGAFTGATQSKQGLLEAADGGSAFLDEVGELPLALQGKLLRILEDREIMRVGSVDRRHIDVRFIAATNAQLPALVEQGRFRRDLFFRLNGMRIDIPPLRDRPADIIPLAQLFADRAARRMGIGSRSFSPDAVRALTTYAWPGNVRELKNVTECALALCGGQVISAEHLPIPTGMRTAPGAQEPPREAGLRGDLQALERARIIDALERCGGNQTLAARELGIPRRTFLSRLDLYGIARPRKSSR